MTMTAKKTDLPKDFFSEKESSVEQFFIKECRRRGIFQFKNKPPPKGIPDRTAIKDGIVLYVELKCRKGRLSENQKQFHEHIRAHGVDVEVIYSKNDVTRVLDKYWPQQKSER